MYTIDEYDFFEILERKANALWRKLNRSEDGTVDQEIDDIGPDYSDNQDRPI